MKVRNDLIYLSVSSVGSFSFSATRRATSNDYTDFPLCAERGPSSQIYILNVVKIDYVCFTLIPFPDKNGSRQFSEGLCNYVARSIGF